MEQFLHNNPGSGSRSASSSARKMDVTLSVGANASLNKAKPPYRATHLWKDVLRSFRTGVPLGKHRSLLWQYDNCFPANVAITWFHAQLQQKYGAAITRRQTLQLLQKFYKVGIICPVSRNPEASDEEQSMKTKETDFKDNRRLYKLVEYKADDVQLDKSNCNNEVQVEETNPKPNNYCVVINQISVDQVFDIWKNVFIERFVHVVGYNVFTTFLKPGYVKGLRIKHNMTEIGSNGVVLVPKAKDLPDWLLSAMLCAMNGFPDTEFTFSKYPTLKADVFRVIREYFDTFKDTTPLLTFELYDAFVSTFIRAAVFNSNEKNVHTSLANHSKRNRELPQQFAQEKYPFTVSDSTEDLLLDMLTPRKQNSSKNANTLDTILSPGSECGDLTPFSPEPMQTMGMDQVYLETAFTGEQSPVTRVISKEEVEVSIGSLRSRPSTLSLQNGNAPIKTHLGYENLHLVLSPADLVNHPKYSKLLAAVTDLHNFPKAFSSSNFPFEAMLKSYGASENKSRDKLGLTRSFDSQILNRPAPPPYRPPCRSHSAVNLSDANQDRSTGQVSMLSLPVSKRNRASDDGDEDDDELRQQLLQKFATSPSRSARKTVKMITDEKKKKKAASTFVMNSEGKEFAIVSFRLLTLLLEPIHRRHLHFLLKFMNKIAETHDLDDSNSTPDIVAEYCRAILGCSVQKEYDLNLAHQIVTFLMIHNQEVFDVTPEDSLRKEAEDQIRQQQIEKIPMNAVSPMPKEATEEDMDKENDPTPKFACSKVTLDEYEDQRLLGGTAQSLRELLATCDALADAKERKRQLKKFRKEYPHIYSEKFGEAETSEIESSTEVVEMEKEAPVSTKKGSRILRALF